MATQKELDALMQLVRAAAEVNASSERVNVDVVISSAQVSVRVSDPIEVLAYYDAPSKWDWLYYDPLGGAYFSSDIFREDKFLERCQDYIGIIKGFEGRTVDEVAQ